jgi:hypothetical protein
VPAAEVFLAKGAGLYRNPLAFAGAALAVVAHVVALEYFDCNRFAGHLKSPCN